ncbi:MAG: hypothetical protein JO004_00930 [Methylobacteriaceae bacterium]|nr:hypothetical protein [Methylobacteriaceae bacterium]
MLDAAKKNAATVDIGDNPAPPERINNKRLWATVLEKHSVRKPDVNTLCAE